MSARGVPPLSLSLSFLFWFWRVLSQVFGLHAASHAPLRVFLVHACMSTKPIYTHTHRKQQTQACVIICIARLDSASRGLEFLSRQRPIGTGSWNDDNPHRRRATHPNTNTEPSSHIHNHFPTARYPLVKLTVNVLFKYPQHSHFITCFFFFFLTFIILHFAIIF